MFIDAVQEQAPLDFCAALLMGHAMLGGQHLHGVAAQPQRVRECLDPEIVSAGMVRRIEIGEDENLHVARAGYGSLPGCQLVTHLWREEFLRRSHETPLQRKVSLLTCALTIWKW